VPTSFPFIKILYPATPATSYDAPQERTTIVSVLVITVRPLGAVGAFAAELGAATADAANDGDAAAGEENAEGSLVLLPMLVSVLVPMAPEEIPILAVRAVAGETAGVERK
jgi:hypothetical protein